jgi:hypothetical protein
MLAGRERPVGPYCGPDFLETRENSGFLKDRGRTMPKSQTNYGRRQCTHNKNNPFDEKAGLVWAILMADGKTRGRPRSALDTIIAAIAKANDCVVVTDNEKDFEGVEFINPMRTAG